MDGGCSRTTLGLRLGFAHDVLSRETSNLFQMRLLITTEVSSTFFGLLHVRGSINLSSPAQILFLHFQFDVILGMGLYQNGDC